tara:strand:- start:336 stop:1340 length:1005 start_codon:yes stop_codon:yes gene_type:complete
MLKLKTPNGFDVEVPENQYEDCTPKFDATRNFPEAIDYYNDNGYVIFSNCLSKKDSDEIRRTWDASIKPYRGTIYRQTTAKAEKNKFNENNWIMNPVLNLQSLNPNLFGALRKIVETKVFTNVVICNALKTILGEKPKIVQSMYFEGNSATWEHQDSYYLDSVKIGKMTAGWLALEEIKADAGRFFICPKSHKIELGRQNINNNIADNHDKYIREVVSIIRTRNMKIKAPYLTTGDFLLWNSWTIHGSIDSQNKSHSRSSITMHAIPESHKFLQLHSREIDVATDNLSHSLIYRPKDQANFKNRLILKIESNFPKIFHFIKRQAVIFLVKNNQN